MRRRALNVHPSRLGRPSGEPPPRASLHWSWDCEDHRAEHSPCARCATRGEDEV